MVSFLVSALPTGIYFAIFFIGPAVMASLGCHTGAVYLGVSLAALVVQECATCLAIGLVIVLFNWILPDAAPL